MEQDATWLLGSTGHEVAGCCIQAATRDMARFGLFIMGGGMAGMMGGMRGGMGGGGMGGMMGGRMQEAPPEGQKGPAQPARQRPALGAKGDGIAKGQPQQAHQTGDGKDMHEDRQHVPTAHQTAVKKGKSGQGHEQDQRGRGQDPGGIRSVHSGIPSFSFL